MSPLEKNHEFRRNETIRQLFERMEKRGFSPVCFPKKVVAHHGTSLICGKKIVLENQLNPTLLCRTFPGQDDFLGEGQYFWLDSKPIGGLTGRQAAVRWAAHKYPGARITVVEANLEFKALFDLSHEKNRSFAEEFLVSLKDAARSFETREMLLAYRDWQLMKLLVLSCPKLAELDIDGVSWNGFSLPSTHGFQQTGLCVKDSGCIRNLRIADE